MRGILVNPATDFHPWQLQRQRGATDEHGKHGHGSRKTEPCTPGVSLLVLFFNLLSPLTGSLPLILREVYPCVSVFIRGPLLPLPYRWP